MPAARHRARSSAIALAVEEQARHADHTVHRSPDLVAHDGQKRALGAGGRLGLGELCGDPRIQGVQATDQGQIEERENDEREQETGPHRHVLLPVFARDERDTKTHHPGSGGRIQIAGAVAHAIAHDDPQVQGIEARTERAHHVHAERDHAKITHDHDCAPADEVPGASLHEHYPRRGKQAVRADGRRRHDHRRAGRSRSQERRAQTEREGGTRQNDASKRLRVLLVNWWFAVHGDCSEVTPLVVFTPFPSLASRQARLQIPAGEPRCLGLAFQRRAPAESSTALTARATVSGVKGFCRKAGGAVEGSAALPP